MKTILFVCHGNICRSPAAEFVMKKLLIHYEIEDDFFVYSRATSREEIGNDIYPPMKRALRNAEIDFVHHEAKQITQDDYDKSDYIFYMDNNNLSYLNFLIKDKDNKYQNITEYSKTFNSIDDPWYTGSFDEVLDQIKECCELIISNILIKK